MSPTSNGNRHLLCMSYRRNGVLRFGSTDYFANYELSRETRFLTQCAGRLLNVDLDALNILLSLTSPRLVVLAGFAWLSSKNVELKSCSLSGSWAKPKWPDLSVRFPISPGIDIVQIYVGCMIKSSLVGHWWAVSSWGWLFSVVQCCPFTV